MATIQERKDKSGKVHYRVQIRLRGYAPEQASFERKTDARLWAQQTEAAMREGRYFKTSEAKKHSLGELIDRYIRDILPKKKSDGEKKLDKGRLAQLLWWKDQIGERLLCDITTSLIVEYRDNLLNGCTCRGQKRSEATVNRYLAALSHAFSVAVKQWEWLGDSPMRNVEKATEPRGRVRFLSDEERKSLLDACKKSSNPYLYIVVVIALSTGMRQAEIMNLKWSDVDLKRERIILNETKNGERRTVHIAGLALQLLKELDKCRVINISFLFPSKDGRNPMDLRFAWEQALKASGIEQRESSDDKEEGNKKDFRFHDLRHSCASYLAMNGASMAEIAGVLGHKTLQMTKRYTHLSDSHLSEVVARMNEKILG